MLTEEIEIDADGKETIRAHNADGSITHIPLKIVHGMKKREFEPRCNTLTEEAMKTVENEDLNSDITANRYPPLIR
jgi:hypothetical protein